MTPSFKDFLQELVQVLAVLLLSPIWLSGLGLILVSEGAWRVVAKITSYGSNDS